MSDLGRCQVGDSVVVDVATPTLPDSHPVAQVTQGEGDFGAFTMARNPEVGGFRVRIHLGPEFVLGSYTVNVTYAVAGSGQSDSFTFMVVAGSDPGGPVISLYSYDRPEGRYVLAQLGAGRLVQGRNPKL